MDVNFIRRKLEDVMSSFYYLVRNPATASSTNSTSLMPLRINLATGTNLKALLSDLRSLGFKDVETLLRMFASEMNGVQDDNQFLLEGMIQLLCRLDPTQQASLRLTGRFVGNLWANLPHPNPTSLDIKYKYRTADGSYNNIWMPDLGKAGSAYTRSARSKVLQNIALPDPGEIFDTLMAREKFEPHPNGVSSMIFYFATLITHDIFKTHRSDHTKTATSSYLDLSPLYGNNNAEQASVRTFKDGHLKPDCFSEQRLLSFPPGVGVIVIMFNRFHNYVATTLASINENGRFTKPSSVNKSEWKKYDNNLFQTARLITCGLYVNCILKDYVRTILNLNRVSSKWDIDPRYSDDNFGANIPEGLGNQVSAEFNLIYRWHSVLSEKDEKWMQAKLSEMIPSKKPEDLLVSDLFRSLPKIQAQLPADPFQRPFANLKRDERTLKYKDDDLVAILTNSITDVAGAFGPNRIPTSLKPVEILAIIQSRAWEVGTLNEFRSFVGLTKHASFESINPDVEVCKKLKRLYSHPDLVELYPGIVAEKTKPSMVPGSGLCVNFTTSWAILSDAVSLVRGDRFYTTDYTPKNLTNWGYHEVNFDKNINDGCVFYKLILNSFPRHFKPDSIFAHYPLVTPQGNLEIFKQLKRAHLYDWDLPGEKDEVILIKSAVECMKITRNLSDWKPKKHGPLHFPRSVQAESLDGLLGADSRGSQLDDADRIIKIIEFYTENTRALLKTHSYKASGSARTRSVDIVQHVSNIVNTRFAASFLDFRCQATTKDVVGYTEQDLYRDLSSIFTQIAGHGDVSKGFEIRDSAYRAARNVQDKIALQSKDVATTNWFLENIFYRVSGLRISTADTLLNFKQNLLHSDATTKKLLPSERLRTTMGVHNVYQPTDKSPSIIIQDGEKKIEVPSGSQVYCDLRSASLDPSTFPNPNSVDLGRPLESYLIQGLDGQDFTLNLFKSPGLAAMFKVVFSLKRLRRAQGCGEDGIWYGSSQGELKGVNNPNGTKLYLTPDWSSFSPFPTTLKIEWDDE